VEVQLFANIGAMVLDRPIVDEKLRSNFLARFAIGDHAENAPFR
jgi:hypothetical protein